MSRASGYMNLARLFKAGNKKPQAPRRVSDGSITLTLSQSSLTRRLQNLTLSPGVETPG